MAGKFNRKISAMNVHRMVDTPRMGILPMTIATATHSASRRGEMPCRSIASSGSRSMRFSQFFKGVFSDCARVSMAFWPRGVARSGAKPLQLVKEIINVQ
jgi:hypothetical protein